MTKYLVQGRLTNNRFRWMSVAITESIEEAIQEIKRNRRRDEEWGKRWDYRIKNGPYTNSKNYATYPYGKEWDEDEEV